MTIEHGSKEYRVERTAKSKAQHNYILGVSVHYSDTSDVRNQDTKILLTGHRRGTITEDVIKEELEQFSEKYPDVEIIGFGVLEECNVCHSKVINDD